MSTYIDSTGKLCYKNNKANISWYTTSTSNDYQIWIESDSSEEFWKQEYRVYVEKPRKKENLLEDELFEI